MHVVSGTPEPTRQRVQLSHGAMACMCLVYLHGINTLYHTVSVYMGMHKTLEILETLALYVLVSKPVSTVLYIPIYTDMAWYNLYTYVCLHLWGEEIK